MSELKHEEILAAADEANEYDPSDYGSDAGLLEKAFVVGFERGARWAVDWLDRAAMGSAVEIIQRHAADAAKRRSGKWMPGDPVMPPTEENP